MTTEDQEKLSEKSEARMPLLRVKLFADDLLVKESVDETTWAAVLNKIVANENER